MNEAYTIIAYKPDYDLQTKYRIPTIMHWDLHFQLTNHFNVNHKNGESILIIQIKVLITDSYRDFPLQHSKKSTVLSLSLDAEDI